MYNNILKLLIVSVLFFLLSCNITNDNQAKEAYADTVKILQCTLDCKIMDTIAKSYKDSTLKIIKTVNTQNQYPISWNNKNVIYLDSNAATMQIDTVGMRQSLRRKDGERTLNEKNASNFEALYTLLVIGSEKAGVHLKFKNMGITVEYELLKKQGHWIVSNYKWYWE